MLHTTSIVKMTVLAAAIAVSGGCVSAKMNPNDIMAEAAPAKAVEKPKQAMAAKPEVMAAVTSYAVVNGDNLWSISKQDQIYGTPFNWPLIYKANSDQINDADLIYAGQSLAIPRDMGQAAIDSAVHHAKTRGSWAVGPTEATDTAYLGG